MGSWVGPWVRFDKMTRRQAIETAEILLEQRDKQIRRAETAEANLAAVLAVPACRDAGHVETLHSAAGCCDPYETPCAAYAASMRATQPVVVGRDPHLFGTESYLP